MDAPFYLLRSSSKFKRRIQELHTPSLLVQLPCLVQSKRQKCNCIQDVNIWKCIHIRGVAVQTHPFYEASGFEVGDVGEGCIFTTRDELEDDNAEAEDIGLDGEGTVHDVLGRHVAVGADGAGLDLAVLRREEAGHAEVSNLRGPILVQQDVAGLDVAMDDGGVSVLVQVQQPSRHPHDHLEPPVPVQLRPLPVPLVSCSCMHAPNHISNRPLKNN